MEREDNLLTIREVWEKYVGKLVIEDFISKPEPCGNPVFYLPTPTIPRHIMDPEKAEEAQKLLSEGTRIVGTWGEKESMKDGEDFKNISTSFKDITGIDIWDIISEARDRRNTLIQQRMGY